MSFPIFISPMPIYKHKEGVSMLAIFKAIYQPINIYITEKKKNRHNIINDYEYIRILPE